jgi:integrase/recombinase XerD
MKSTAPFTSKIGGCIMRYLELKTALGRTYTTERRILQHLDKFLTATNADMTYSSFSQWCKTRTHLSAGVRRSWMRVARNLCLYRRRTKRSCFVPDPSLFPRCHQPIEPYIFSEADICRVFNAIRLLKPSNRSLLYRENMYLAVVLLYTTGMRRGELTRLTCADYDPRARTLRVRESKFHKSRLLPLSADGAHCIEQHLAARRSRRIMTDAGSPLLWNGYRDGTGYTGSGLGYSVHNIIKQTNIRTPSGRLPRLHDFRHTFAVHALLRWYRNGDDAQAKLPMLSVYMGHVSIVSTEYYLRFMDELSSAASKRFAQHYGSLVIPIKSGGGDQ